MSTPIGVGVIGASASRAWGTRAHIPAMQASPSFALRAVSTSRRETAEASSKAFGVPGYDNAEALMAQPDVDLVVIAVKVPHHAELVRAALAARKSVFCEWPLGNGLPEAEALAGEAAAAGVRNFIGLQARSGPELTYLRRLVGEGWVGEVLSSSIVASGGAWGAEIPPDDAYVLDRSTGASMLTIPFAHTFDAVLQVLGGAASVSAETATRRPFAVEEGTGRHVPITVADQIVLAAELGSGAPLSMHFRGGMSAGTNFLWEINGTEGDLLVTADSGHIQMAPLTVQGAKKGQSLAPLPTPADCRWAPKGTPNGFPLNVGQAYALIAQDLADGGRRAPTFNDAVHLHRLLHLIEQSADEGKRLPTG